VLVPLACNKYRAGESVDPRLAGAIAGEIRDAIQAEASGFALPDAAAGEGAVVKLKPAPGETRVSAEDVIETVKVVDAHASEVRIEPGSRLALTIRFDGDERPTVDVVWSDTGDGQGRELRWIRGLDVSYGGYFCGLQSLRALGAGGLGSDFSRIGECSPDLEELVIGDWGSATGREGLADLGRLKALGIGGTVGDVTELPRLSGLEAVVLARSADTPQTRAALEERYPKARVAAVDRLALSLGYW
jgi:hypothetical protein